MQTTDREHRFCFSPAAVVTHAFSSRGHLKYQSAASHMHAEHPSPKECTREGKDYCLHPYKSVSVYKLYANKHRACIQCSSAPCFHCTAMLPPCQEERVLGGNHLLKGKNYDSAPNPTLWVQLARLPSLDTKQICFLIWMTGGLGEEITEIQLSWLGDKCSTEIF